MSFETAFENVTPKWDWLCHIHLCFVLLIVCLCICVCECLPQNNNHKEKHKNNTTSKPRSSKGGGTKNDNQKEIHQYALCPVLYLSPSLCFLSSFSANFIDTYVTVPIDVRITPLICLDSFPSTSSFLTSLPPHVHLCLHPNIHTYFNTSSGPFIRTSCFLMCSLTCKFLRMCTSTCIRISLLLHVHTQLPPFSYVWLMFSCIIITIFLFSFLCF